MCIYQWRKKAPPPNINLTPLDFEENDVFYENVLKRRGDNHSSLSGYSQTSKIPRRQFIRDSINNRPRNINDNDEQSYYSNFGGVEDIYPDVPRNFHSTFGRAPNPLQPPSSSSSLRSFLPRHSQVNRHSIGKRVRQTYGDTMENRYFDN